MRIPPQSENTNNSPALFLRREVAWVELPEVASPLAKSVTVGTSPMGLPTGPVFLCVVRPAFFARCRPALEQKMVPVREGSIFYYNSIVYSYYLYCRRPLLVAGIEKRPQKINGNVSIPPTIQREITEKAKHAERAFFVSQAHIQTKNDILIAMYRS